MPLHKDVEFDLKGKLLSKNEFVPMILNEITLMKL